jgi:hypothetical protein
MLRGLLFFSFFLFSFSQQKEHSRWTYKLLTDKEGVKLMNAKAVSTTIEALDSITRPLADERKYGRAKTEKIKVTVDAYIIARGKEEDGDYHLVLQGLTTNKTLIAEIPSPENPELDNFPTLKNLYSESRNFIDSAMGVPSRKVTGLRSKRKVKVTGILFFDKLTHGKGHAISGIEIHPVLSIQ